MTGQNGGGAFVLVYLITIAVVGFPIFISNYISQNHNRSCECFQSPRQPKESF